MRRSCICSHAPLPRGDPARVSRRSRCTARLHPSRTPPARARAPARCTHTSRRHRCFSQSWRRSARGGRLQADGRRERWLHPRGHWLRAVLSGGQQLSGQQVPRARWHRVAALLRSVGQMQRPTKQFGLLSMSNQRSERAVGCNRRSGIAEEQRRAERRSFGVSFLGLVAFRVLLRTFYVCNGSVCTVSSAVSIA